MSRPFCRIAAVTAAIAALQHPARADDQARLEAEGIAVLRVAAALDVPPIGESLPCRIDAEWSTATVPQDIARKVFGLKLRADLAASEPIPDSHAVLSAVEPDPARLCSHSDLRKQREAARAVLPEDTRFSYHLASFSFPIFDRAFSKAVVVWRSLTSAGRLGGDGKAGGIAFTDTALTFVKRRSGWVLAAQEVIGQT